MSSKQDEPLVDEQIYDFQEVQWNEYLMWCRANEATPTLSDFLVWQSDYDDFE